MTTLILHQKHIQSLPNYRQRHFPMVEDYISTNHIVEATTATGKRISETKMMPTVMHSTFWNDGFGRWAIVYYVSKSVAVTVLSIMFQNL